MGISISTAAHVVVVYHLLVVPGHPSEDNTRSFLCICIHHLAGKLLYICTPASSVSYPNIWGQVFKQILISASTNCCGNPRLSFKHFTQLVVG